MLWSLILQAGTCCYTLDCVEGQTCEAGQDREKFEAAKEAWDEEGRDNDTEVRSDTPWQNEGMRLK